MRLIDADALPREKQLEAFGNGQYEDVEIVYGNDIDNAPTVDAVSLEDYQELQRHFINWEPVVRCGDCRHRGTLNCRWVDDYEDFPSDDDYCSYGKRRDDER